MLHLSRLTNAKTSPTIAAIRSRAACLLLLALLFPGIIQAQQPPRIVGGPAGGCIAGAVQLPSEGPGYQTIRATKSFFWGHPATIAALELLAVRAHAAGLPDLYMNDISKPRGGPFPGIHASHMLGLDADVWLDLHPKPRLTPAQRDNLEPDSLVRPDGHAVDPTRWTPQHTTLIRLATTLPGLDRILVNPAIKQQLCTEVHTDRSWHLIRPWYGHSAHMHLHFRCPPGQPECTDQPPPPAIEGCDASLQWWFDQLDAPPTPASAVRPPRPLILPAPCAAIMAGQPPQ